MVMKTSGLLIGFLFFSLVSYAQVENPDREIWKEPWVSCDKRMNPKEEYGKSHWIQYDLGKVRPLSKTRIWNVNDPENLEQGFKEVQIDYSEDGKAWINYGMMTFPKGEGTAVYGGFQGPDLVGVKARFVLFTATENYGDRKCSGLTEVKFNLLPEQMVYTREEMDEEDEDEDDPNCIQKGLIYLTDGSVVELEDFDSNHNYEQSGGYAIETHKGWVEIPYNTIDKVEIRHEAGNKFNYQVTKRDGEVLKGWSNVFRNFVEGNSKDGFQMINYEEIDYFTVELCD